MRPRTARWALALVVLLALGCKKMERASRPESVGEAPMAGLQARLPDAAPEKLKALGYVGGDAVQSVEAPTAADSAKATPAAPPASVALRKLIRRVELDLVVRDTEKAAREAQELAERFQGFVESSNAHREGELMYYTLVLRIPAPRLAEALALFKKGAERIDREQQGVEDVTSQYVDLTARLTTLKATEVELRALLAESRSRGRKVGEIMEVYRELTEIRTQIEQIEAQVRTFDQLAALSTIKLTLSPTEAAKPVAAPGWHPLDTVRSAFRSLVALLRGGVELLIFLVIVVLPVLVVLWLALKGLGKLRRALRRRRD